MTIRSVAEKAGVAVDTARKVVRGDPSVRPYIRQRVLAVIRETGYKPNLVARALRQNHLNLVPLTIMSLDQPYFGRIATRLSELIVDWGAEPALCLNTSHLVTLCHSYSTRGCVSANHIDLDVLKLLSQTQRVVVINQDVPASQNVSVIAIDFSSAYRTLAENVLAHGCRRIAMVSSYYIESGLKGWPRQKFPAVFEVLAANGLTSVGPKPDHVFGSAAELGAWMKKHRDSIDAVICENDHAGASVIGELAHLGLSTPRDILVTGCDADIPLSGMWTIRPDTDTIASLAISRLRAMIDNDVPGSRIVHVPIVVDNNGNPLRSPFRSAS